MNGDGKAHRPDGIGERRGPGLAAAPVNPGVRIDRWAESDLESSRNDLAHGEVKRNVRSEPLRDRGTRMGACRGGLFDL